MAELKILNLKKEYEKGNFSAKNESKNRIFRKKRTCMALMFQIPYMLCF